MLSVSAVPEAPGPARTSLICQAEAQGHGPDCEAPADCSRHADGDLVAVREVAIQTDTSFLHHTFLQRQLEAKAQEPLLLLDAPDLPATLSPDVAKQPVLQLHCGCGEEQAALLQDPAEDVLQLTLPECSTRECAACVAALLPEGECRPTSANPGTTSKRKHVAEEDEVRTV